VVKMMLVLALAPEHQAKAWSASWAGERD